MRRVDYDVHQHAVYESGRTLPDRTLSLWGRVFGECGLRDRHVLDLGAGTGRFSRLMADDLGCRVVGVEPSGNMRSAARALAGDREVKVIGGAAEALPLRDDATDAALLSQCIHHFTDLDAGAREVVRVVRPGGPVVVRSCFGGRLDGVAIYSWFPEALEVDEERLPSLEQTTGAFEAAGARVVHVRRVEQVVDESLAAFAERMSHRAISTFELIDDRAFDEGLGRLREAARTEVEPEPVIEPIDVLVLHAL